MPVRVEPKDLNVEYVRHPRQRVPVRFVAGGECPYNRLCGQAVLNIDVVGYVFDVVDIDEIAPGYVPESYHRGNSQNDMN